MHMNVYQPCIYTVILGPTRAQLDLQGQETGQCRCHLHCNFTPGDEMSGLMNAAEASLEHVPRITRKQFA